MRGPTSLLVIAAACFSVQALRNPSREEIIQYKECTRKEECKPFDECNKVIQDFVNMKTNKMKSIIRNNVCQLTRSSQIYVCCPKSISSTKKSAVETMHQCGEPRTQDYKSPGNYPWYAQLIYSNKMASEPERAICNGALISHQFVLTAARCVNESGWELTHVRLGDQKRNLGGCTYCGCAPGRPSSCRHPDCKPDSGCQYSVSRVAVGSGGAASGLALLRLAKPVQDRQFIPVCLPPKSYTLPRNKSLILLGRSRVDTMKSNTTLAHRLTYLACARSVRVDGGHLCVQTPGGLVSHTEDIGSPLMIDRGYPLKKALLGLFVEGDKSDMYLLFRKINSDDQKWIEDTMSEE